jgi:uncharacterized membrane protein YfcA
MLLSPWMMELGLPPVVAGATSSALVFLASSSAAISFALEGKLNVPFALSFGAATAVSALFAVFLLAQLVKKSGRPSMLVFLLASLMAVGAASTAAFAGRHAVADIAARRHLGLRNYCAME